MSGSTMVMAPAMDSSSPSGISRSHSTPELMNLSSYPYEGTSDKPRSDADYDMPAFDDSFKLDTSFFLRDGSSAAKEVAASGWRPSAPAADADATPDQQTTLRRSRTGSLMERPRSWFPTSKSTPREKTNGEAPRPSTSVGEDVSADTRLGSSSGKTSVQSSLANFAKRSWLSSSGSPAPKRRPNTAKSKKDDDSDSSTKPTARRRADLTPESQATQNRKSEPVRPTKAFNRASSYFSKKKQSLKKMNNVESDTSCASSSTSLAPPTNTTDARTSQSTSHESNTTTDDSSTDMPPLPPQNRDPLWSQFKNLEVEHKGFTTKSTPQRVIQVQTIVLPFLRDTIDHPSTKELVPEDVDRRAVILDKWWNGLLDMMDGVGMGSVPGVDRPVVFDAMTAIMERSEWRQTTTSFLPLNDRSPRERIRSRSWTNASESTDGSAFAAESAEHNVRTMFVSNLAKQMSFAVDMMAMRHAPEPVVTFAGKTCAYAFFFVPGVADILVRLWGMGPELIRRAADELGLPRRNKGESEDIVALFPPKLAAFGWTSPKSMWNSLKQIPKMPVLISRISWTGPWVARWKGRDTDLLFVFYKQFHQLADNFMPSGLPLTEKARSPGFVLVHAQLLSIIDDTIHRQAAIGGPAVMDPMPGADASAMAMPLPPPNLMKGMNENSLVMLLKDILAEDSPKFGGAKHTFAEVCVAMIKAAVRKTSQFDNAACFTLCDFLEEALTIYDNFEDPVSSKKYIDWRFWMDVFKRISTSYNTMSEVRVLSFIFTIWDMVAKDPSRKAAICLDWLLTAETFDTFFNHWCPMVRAYYQRLLCWRICRCEGDADEVDESIYLVVAARLKETWAHYLYLKQTAEETGRLPPSTAPTVPTPGKKFLIIKQELNQPQPGLFVNFDAMARTPGSEVIEGEDLVDNPPAKQDGKKKWGLLGKVLSLGNGNGSKGHERKSSWDDEFANARRETAELRTRVNAPSNITTSSSGSSEMDSACSSPVYEEQKFVFRFFLAWQQQPIPPRDRILTRPRLPAPAQAIVSLRAHCPADMTPLPSEGRASLEVEEKDQTPVDEPTSEADAAAGVTIETPATFVDQAQGIVTEPVTQPVKPTGIAAKQAAYAGRALAEWGQVIWECNNFVDRRRDEGIPSLAEVEVPLLGVESFRKPGG